MKKLIIPALLALAVTGALSLGGCSGSVEGVHEGMAAFIIDGDKIIRVYKDGDDIDSLCTYDGDDAAGDLVELRGADAAASSTTSGVWVITKCTHTSKSHFGFGF